MKRKNTDPKTIMAAIKNDGKMGVSHFLAMLGATILVPLLANLSVSVALLSAGLGTLLFLILTRKKVPVFLGASFAFLPGLMAIMCADGIESVGSNSWQYAMGGLVVAIWLAGLLYIVVATLLRVVGLKKIRKIFPAYIVGPVVIVIGLTLIPKVLYRDVLSPYWDYSFSAWKQWAMLIATALGIIIVSSFAKPKKILSLTAVLCGFGIGYACALVLDGIEMLFLSGDIGQTLIFIEFSRYSSLNWSQVVIFQDMESYFGFWRYLHFDLNSIVLICPISLVAIIEHINNIDEISQASGTDYLLDPGVDQTIVGQGIGTMFSGLVGGIPIVAYSENAAIMETKKDYRVKPLAIAAIIAIVLGMLTPLANLVYTIPKAVVGGTAIIILGMIAVRGVKMAFYAREELRLPRNSAIMALILAIGLGLGSMSFVSDITGDEAFKIVLWGIEISPLFLASFAGIALNLLLPYPKVSHSLDNPPPPKEKENK